MSKRLTLLPSRMIEKEMQCAVRSGSICNEFRAKPAFMTVSLSIRVMRIFTHIMNRKLQLTVVSDLFLSSTPKKLTRWAEGTVRKIPLYYGTHSPSRDCRPKWRISSRLRIRLVRKCQNDFRLLAYISSGTPVGREPCHYSSELFRRPDRPRNYSRINQTHSTTCVRAHHLARIRYCEYLR